MKGIGENTDLTNILRFRASAYIQSRRTEAEDRHEKSNQDSGEWLSAASITRGNRRDEEQLAAGLVSISEAFLHHPAAHVERIYPPFLDIAASDETI
jgi:outer membrane PBP1 activator LpoA protein